MFSARIKKIKEILSQQKLNAIFISNVSNIIYLTGFSNFSKEEREAYLIITKTSQYIITDGRYTEAVRKGVPHFELLERSAKNSLKDIFKKFKGVKVLGIEEDDLKISEYKFIRKYFKKLKGMDISKIREIKDAEEVEKISKACALGDEAFKFILTKIKVGVTEKEIAFDLENFIKKQGGHFSFDPIIAFGANSSVPHHQTSDTVLGPETSSGRQGQIILVDFGIKYENYCSDMTRTIFFGKPTDKQKDIYETVREAQQRAADFIIVKLRSKQKVKIDQVDKVAREVILAKNYPDIPHSLGHGIGLQVHEIPYLSSGSKDVLEEGMVFSIEPGIYLPDFGGVRIEDLFAITGGKLKKLTNSASSLIIT